MPSFCDYQINGLPFTERLFLFFRNTTVIVELQNINDNSPWFTRPTFFFTAREVGSSNCCSFVQFNKLIKLPSSCLRETPILICPIIRIAIIFFPFLC